MKRLGIAILVVITVVLSTFLLVRLDDNNKVLAQTSCPSYMDPISDACFNYLRNQLETIRNQQGNLQKQLKDEDYQQLSLQEKINYLNSLISQTEQKIQSLQIEIAATDIEISLLEKEIIQNEDSVSILKQEINTLSSSVNDRITESYKYSFINQFELFLDVKNFSTVLRKSKYLATTRSNDKKALERYSLSVSELEKVEAKLQENKIQLELKRASREEEKTELAASKSELDKQKGDRQILLAESKAKEAQLAAQLQALVRQSNEVTAQIQAIAMTLYRTGQIKANTPVTTSTILGYQGHTGFAYGSHLHFNLSGKSSGPFELGYFSTSGGKLYSNRARVPAGDGAWLTQNYHYGYSIDMVGTYSGFNGQKYTVAPNSVCCTGSLSYMGCIPAGSYNMNGEGSPIYPIKAGVATRVVTDLCGGKYVIVDHGGGELTMYLHLR